MFALKTATSGSHLLSATHRARLRRGFWLALGARVAVPGRDRGAVGRHLALPHARRRDEGGDGQRLVRPDRPRNPVFPRRAAHPASGLRSRRLGPGLGHDCRLASARERFGRMVLLWFCLLAAAAIAYNVVVVPENRPRCLLPRRRGDARGAACRRAGRVSRRDRCGGADLARRRAGIGAAGRVSAATVSARRGRCSARGGVRLGVRRGASGAGQGAAGHERPHVILLGIDSLRLDYVQRFGGTGVTKHLDRFLARGGHRARHDDAGRADVSRPGPRS